MGKILILWSVLWGVITPWVKMSAWADEGLGPERKQYVFKRLRLPKASELDELTIKDLLDDLVQQGLIRPDDAEKVKRRVEGLTLEDWQRIRTLTQFHKRGRAIASLGNAYEQNKEKIWESKLTDEDEFDVNRYQRLSREVNSVFNVNKIRFD